MALWPPSSATVKQALAAHSLLGISAAALLYLLCLSGALAVLYPDLQRWEQAAAPELSDYPPELADRAIAGLLPQLGDQRDHIDMVLPTADYPRLTVIANEREWLIDGSGQAVAEVSHPFTHFLLHLHTPLHLPQTLGLAVVGIGGVLLLALALTGILAHPRLLRDAFRWRWGSGGRERQLDLHNRLSVWGLPFILTIAITGAYFGLALLMLGGSAELLYGGDQQRVMAPFAGNHPPDDATPAPLMAIAPALSALRASQPDAAPFYLELADGGSAGQHLEIIARLPGRLIYGEHFTYGGDGRLWGTNGLADGPLGKQIFASTYPLHFGSFGGLPLRLLYLLLGLALCLIISSGVQLWLGKRQQRGLPSVNLQRWWVTTLWATPLLLALAALVSPWLAEVWLVTLFWAGYGLLTLLTPWLPAPRQWRQWLWRLLVLVVAALLVSHGWRFAGASLGAAALTSNSLLLLTALVLLGALRRRPV